MGNITRAMLERAARDGDAIDVRLPVKERRPAPHPRNTYSTLWNAPPIDKHPVPEAKACNRLRDACLNLFDDIVDRTGCSFVAAMERCGVDGAVAL